MCVPNIPIENLEITYLEDVPNKEDYSGVLLPFSNTHLLFGNVTTVKELTSGEDVKAVYDIGIDTTGLEYDYIIGDTIGMFPENNEDDINAILNRLQLLNVADKAYTINVVPNSSSKKKSAIPGHIPKSGFTLRQLFTTRLDINSFPKKLFLRELAQYTSCEFEKAQLEVLGSVKGTTEYNDFISNDGKSLLQILNKFPKLQPTITKLLEHLPPLRPRVYSIITSPLSIEKEIRIAVSVLNTNKGICSGWLEKNLKPQLNKEKCNFTIPYYFRRSNQFHLPNDTAQPIIMVGPGTGVAPFIGFLRHRFLQQKNLGQKLGESWLFFGCRYSQRDFLYKEELQNFVETKILTKLITSFSRESPMDKVYVQHMMLRNGKEITDLLLNQNAVFYVCGDAKCMRKDIKYALTEILIDNAGKDQAESEKLISEWQKSEKYIEDIWM